MIPRWVAFKLLPSKHVVFATPTHVQTSNLAHPLHCIPPLSNRSPPPFSLQLLQM